MFPNIYFPGCKDLFAPLKFSDMLEKELALVGKQIQIASPKYGKVAEVRGGGHCNGGRELSLDFEFPQTSR